jgi:5-methylcytosine-specific restriction endonuclease McrA
LVSNRNVQQEGVPANDVWQIPFVAPSAKERIGYPTQKPLDLYERIIRASSNPGDVVLDPFCGCATTPIAAEKLGRQWIGMDIWDGAYDVVQKRLEGIGLTSDVENDPRLTTVAEIIYTKTPPIRTDETDDDPTLPDLVLRPQRLKAKWERLSREEMRDILASAQANGTNVICAGCGIALPVRYMQLDHNLPRKDGGENVITNRILLCGPCNLNKSARLTLSGLRDFNRREGYMADRNMAELASSKARDAAERCRVEIV